MTFYLNYRFYLFLCFQSLRDSLLDHGGKLNSESPQAIVTQVYIIRHALTKFCSTYYLINFRGDRQHLYHILLSLLVSFLLDSMTDWNQVYTQAIYVFWKKKSFEWSSVQIIQMYICNEKFNTTTCTCNLNDIIIVINNSFRIWMGESQMI